jgi:MOSC domain-containing protein
LSFIFFFYWFHQAAAICATPSSQRATEATITRLIIYPVKSCGGIELDECRIDELGLENDRRYMFVRPYSKRRDPQEWKQAHAWQMITGRDYPNTVMIHPIPGPDGLLLRATHLDDLPDFFIPHNAETETIPVQVWDDVFDADRIIMSASASATASATATDVNVSSDSMIDLTEWLTRAVGTSCDIVKTRSLEKHTRGCRSEYDIKEERDSNVAVGMADGFPILLCSEDSARWVNQQSKTPVSIANFRPNIVVDGDNVDAFEEDFWLKVQAETTDLFIRKPCDRCVFTTVDPNTGVRNRTGEPLKTMRKYRLKTATGYSKPDSNRVYFGQNIIHGSVGETLKVGQSLKVVETV